jgi:hypothetical protein
VVSRPLEGEAPTIDLAVGYSKSNTSSILKLFLSRLEELRALRLNSAKAMLEDRSETATQSGLIKPGSGVKSAP